MLVILFAVVAVGCYTVADGQYVRLAGSSLYCREGRLEVYYNGIWGTVCDDSFADVDARVACNSIGYGYIGYTIGNQYGAGSGQIWMDDVACYGNETSIVNCKHKGWGVHNCGHREDVSVACYVTTVRPTTTRTTSTTTRYGQQVRLAGSSSYQEGRLEVYYNGVWGTVCNDDFSDVDARVACYSLGYGYIGYTLGTRYGAGSGQIWLDGVACSGYETSIGNCRHNGWGVHNCVHSEDVSIACYPSTTTTTWKPPTSTEKEHDCDKHCPCNCNGYSGWGCFDGFSTVQMADRRAVKMTDLQVGDNVLTVDITTQQPTFAEVITFLHIDRNSSAEFIVIRTKSGAKITLTPNHLIFTRDKEATDDTAPTEVFAGSIMEGDLVYLSEPEGPTTIDEVTKIVRVQLVNAGIYAPLTSTGTIVVDGILASCYGSFHSHHLSHAAMFPLRVHHTLKMNVHQEEQFDERGIHWYAAALTKVVGYIVPQQSTWWWH